MRNRPLWVVLALLLFVPSSAGADDHRADFFGGISFARGSVLTGFHLGGTISPGAPQSPYKSFLYDFSLHSGKGSDPDLKTMLFGFAHTLTTSERAKKFVPVPHGTIGFVSADGTKFAGSAGASLDVVLASNTARDQQNHPAIRLQYDRVFRDDAKDFDRYTIALAWRWPKK